VCGLRKIVSWWSLGSYLGLQRATSLMWHNVGDDGASVQLNDLLSPPLQGGGGVCCVVCVYLCGVYPLTGYV
jgi:hypothetical protein